MGYERITNDPKFNGPVRDSHEYRYKIAGSYILPTDIVLDAACGTGYGKKFINCANYYGVDRIQLGNNIVGDLNTWRPDFDFDVFISFETIEHIHNYKNVIDFGKQAKRIMCVSTPIVPSVGSNEFHVHDFTFDQISNELIDDNWELIHSETQNADYGIWTLQRRKS